MQDKPSIVYSTRIILPFSLVESFVLINILYKIFCDFTSVIYFLCLHTPKREKIISDYLFFYFFHCEIQLFRIFYFVFKMIQIVFLLKFDIFYLILKIGVKYTELCFLSYTIYFYIMMTYIAKKKSII